MLNNALLDRHFAPVWELLLKEFNQVANYHSEMAHQVSQTIEKPLRASPSEDYHRLQQVNMEPPPPHGLSRSGKKLIG